MGANVLKFLTRTLPEYTCQYRVLLLEVIQWKCTVAWSNVPLLVTEQIVNFPWPLKCKCCSYDLKPDYIMANVLLSFAFCVHPEQKRDTNKVDTYFAFTKKFSICWSKCSRPNTFDWSQREISVNCRQISGSVTFSVLVFHGYVNQNDFSHAVRGPGEKRSCTEVILNVPLLFGSALL